MAPARAEHGGESALTVPRGLAPAVVTDAQVPQGSRADSFAFNAPEHTHFFSSALPDAASEKVVRRRF